MGILVRLGTRSHDEFIGQLNQKNEGIQRQFLSKMSKLTGGMTAVKVMMGDSTITRQETFDPSRVVGYFEKINDKLRDWSLQDVTVTNNEGLRRIFSKFEVMEGNYLILGHVSLQFHVLLYYKPDQRVLDCQKELSNVVDQTKNSKGEISDNSDQFVLDKLRETGCKDFDHQKLFELLYENDNLREGIYAEIEKNTGADFQKLSEKEERLLNELDSLLIETYQTSPVLIDDNRLIAGEEGCLCTIDLEFVKNKNREGLFDPRKISDTVKKNILGRLDEFEGIINQRIGR